MSRRRADSQDSLEPDDEVMPYSDDETDDELDASSEGEPAEPPGAPQPPVDAKVSGQLLNANSLIVTLFLRKVESFAQRLETEQNS